MAAGKEIRRLRDQAEISAAKLADYMGVDAARLRKWESRDSDPSESDAIKVERYFGVPIRGLDKLDKFEFYRPQEDITPEKPDQGKLVPYYDINVTAGNIEVFTGENKEQIHSMVRVPSMMDVDAFVNVSGSSMRDKYCSGDIIGVKKINHVNFIEWGEAHVVITRDDRRLFKYVRKSKDKEFIVLRSENREENDDIDLPVSLVVSMFIVKGLIRRKAM